MDYGIKGKLAMVTGAGSQVGIGKAVCLILAKEGCDVVSVDTDLEGAKRTANAVEALGHKSLAMKVDVTKGPEVNEVVEAILKEFGKIDILVNNAGLLAGLGVPVLESKQETWEKNIVVNLYGMMNCVKAVIPGMIKCKYGKIINFSSIAAKMGRGDSYSASKAGIEAVTRGLAAEYGPSGINVNAVAPGYVNTNIFGDLGERTNEFFEQMAARTPLRRIQTVEDIANVVAFLASDVSRNITGQCLQVDSGLVMR